VFNPATPDLPLLPVRYSHVQLGSQHLRFALSTMNPRLEGSVVDQNDFAPFLHD
jgi:hypothetical protein